MPRKKRYPHRVKCREGLEVEIRPLRAEDVPAMRELHKSLEESVRALLRENIVNPYYGQRVKRQLEDDHILRLVAWHDKKIVASLALHRARARWRKHTCEIRAIVRPDFRRFGITMVLIEESIPFAKAKGIEKIYVNLMPEQKAAISLVKHIGFRREATLKDHVKDEYGSYHDIRTYSIDLEAAHKAMDALLADMTGYSG